MFARAIPIGVSKFTILHNTNYAKLQRTKKSGQSAPLPNVHFITSKDQNTAIDLIRWVLAVAGIRADSPRFAYYVSRWRVPEKIFAAKKAGTFTESIANCPPIDPAWVRFVPDAITEYQAFANPQPRPPTNKGASSATQRPARNRQRLAA
ncbi:hypothetical protein [Dechloromonas sp. A34]|uniref:hypothetical protein n=1 Tax=Dechloromonas sp. A34 TaxID=447588 RepID=UPI0022490B13|nr:hypothetical protein [Dechloromonas sp. A34]